MFYTLEGFTHKIPMSPVPLVTVKNPSARKSLHKFTELLDVKKETSVRQLGATKFKRNAIRAVSILWSSIPNWLGHRKIMHGSRKLFIIGLYNILGFCNPWLPMIDLNYILTVTLNHSWFQNYYFKCLSNKFTVVWLVPHNRVHLGSHGMLTTISSLLILGYVPFYHHNSKNVCIIWGNVWLWVLYIHQKYTFIVTIVVWSLFE